MTAFTRKSVNVRTLGEHLRLCREALGFSVVEVAQISKVQQRYIKALEESDFKSLPATVYVKGFLRTLARVYHLSENDLAEGFQSERGIAENLQILPARLPRGLPGFRFIWNAKAATITVLSVLSLGIGLYLYSQVSSLQQPPRLKLISPEEDGTVSSSLLLVRGETEPGATVYLNNQPIALDADGNFQETISLGPGTNQLGIRAVNKFNKEAMITRSVVLAEKDIAGSFTAATGSSPILDTLELEIKIGLTASWINISADGAEIYSGTMLAGSSRKVTAQEKITLTSGNAGTTRVILSGRDLGVLGKEGEIIRDVEFTK